MENFKNYFKFPLFIPDNDYDIAIYTNDKKRAFIWLIDISNDNKQEIINAINGEGNFSTKDKILFTHKNGVIYCNVFDDDINKEYKIMRVRGWGMLTGIGAYNLPLKEASIIQDEFIDYCVKRLNNE